ncbi:hypothetical protein EMEDMD4_930019 [Sinorhizobium medicae]|uniref:Type II/III secretion system secretin-like domain-containing protein n=1 Tax=Sinorhizobium medicae TaxID=110321 RepID=A0A508X853_9HYPH|nr:hypothetical protein EMEDMD4_930019 [Sinorhizobium medicae]
MIPATLSECMRPASVFAVNLAGDSMFRITPVVGDVPILGELFKSKRFQRNETELVILITPYLVSPTSERKMKTPLDSPSGAITSPRSKTKPVVNKGYGFYVE